jgi:membrane protease YdiL (CAAX protease family)
MPVDDSTRTSVGARGWRRGVETFVGSQRLRSGWKAVLFVSILVMSHLSTRPMLDRIAPSPSLESVPLNIEAFRYSWYVFLVFATTWVMARIERRSVFSYGFSSTGRLSRLLTGAGCGFLSLSVLVGALWLHGSLAFDNVTLPGGFLICVRAAEAGIIFLLVGLVEESVFRGYLQFTLTRAIGFWWAALIVSAAFGMGHAHKSMETPFGLMGIGLGALLFTLSLWYTRSLYWAVGFHAAWDWGHDFFYGWVEPIPGHLMTTRAIGNPLWSGGTAGAEASVMILPLFALLVAGMCLWWGRGKPALGLRVGLRNCADP